MKVKLCIKLTDSSIKCLKVTPKVFEKPSNNYINFMLFFLQPFRNALDLQEYKKVTYFEKVGQFLLLFISLKSILLTVELEKDHLN